MRYATTLITLLAIFSTWAVIPVTAFPETAIEKGDGLPTGRQGAGSR
ncbi:hypothetical protein [Pantanalinema sp. GBBB05]